MHYEEDETLGFLTDVLCHEEDHRIIHGVTRSAKTTLAFDWLFYYPFDQVANRGYFRHGDVDLFKETLTSLGKMIEEKAKAAQRKSGDH